MANNTVIEKSKTIDKHFMQRENIREFKKEFNYCAIKINSLYYKINKSKFLQVFRFIKLNFDLYKVLWLKSKIKKSIATLKYLTKHYRIYTKYYFLICLPYLNLLWHFKECFVENYNENLAWIRYCHYLNILI